MKDVFDLLNYKDLKCIDMIFIDASNAFDTLPHHELLNELQVIGILGPFLELLIDYFTNRYQYVKYNDIVSSYEVISGVLQGGVLSPLYNIFVRNFPSILKACKPFKFANDTNLIKAIFSDSDANNFQLDLSEILNWFTKKKILN
jgi:hypothetical protein